MRSMNIELNDAEIRLIFCMLENWMESLSDIDLDDNDSDIDEVEREEFKVATSLYEKLCRNN